MKVKPALASTMKTDGNCMTRIERGLENLARIDDASSAAKTPLETAQCDVAFASSARAVARNLTNIARDVQARPVVVMQVFRGYVAEEAVKATQPRAYGPYAQRRSLAAKLLLPGVDRAVARAA